MDVIVGTGITVNVWGVINQSTPLFVTWTVTTPADSDGKTQRTV